MNASSQAKVKEEAHAAIEQKLHLCEELPSSASTKIPPDKTAKEQASKASSYEPPGTEMQSHRLPALLCNEAASQPKVKRHSTATTPESEGITKDPPIAIHNDAANQPWSSFNVKPPPHSQTSHGAEVSLSDEVEWNGSATKFSASVEVQLREYGPISKDSEFVEEKHAPPDNELLQTKVATEESNKTVTNSAPEAQAGGLHSPALLTTEALPIVNHHALNDHSLFGPSEDESTAEFFPVPFSLLAGDDGFFPQQVKYII